MTVFERAIYFAKGVAFPRLLGSSQYGAYNLAFFFISLVNVVSDLGISNAYTRYIPKYEIEGGLKHFVWRITKFSIISMIIVLTIAALFCSKLSLLIFKSKEFKILLSITIVAILFNRLYQIIFKVFYGLRFFKARVLLNFTQTVGFTIFAIILSSIYHRAEAAIGGDIISYIIPIFFFGFLLLKYFRQVEYQDAKITERDFYKNKLKYSIWFMIIPLQLTLFGYVGQLMLNHLTNLDNVGIYSAAAALSSPLFLVGQVVGEAFFPNMNELWDKGKKQEVFFFFNFASKIIILLSFAPGLVLVFSKQWLIPFLFGHEYVEGISVVVPFVTFNIFNSVYWVIAMYPKLIERTHLGFIASSIGLISNTILNYFLIQYYGLAGAAYSTCISHGLILAIAVIINMKTGMEFQNRTLLIYLLPAILLSNQIVGSVLYFITILSIFRTRWILDSREKEIVITQVKKQLKIV